jgi:hypothetical protein
MSPEAFQQAQDRRAAGQPPFVICEIVSGKVVARVPHASDRSSGEALIEAARRARGERCS